MSPQQKKGLLFRTFLAQLEGLAAREAVLIVLEDAHWLDPTSRELFDQIVDRLQRLPVLLVVTFRPDLSPPWIGFPHVTLLTLNRLAKAQARSLVERVTGGKALPSEVLEEILARTEGVPLFTEELTKTVLESGFLGDAGDRYVLAGPLPPLAIPATLHDSLMARLDRLAPVKEVAQIGACIGREFDHEFACRRRFTAGGRASNSARSISRRGAYLPPRRCFGNRLHLQACDGPRRSL
jgi:predicted ATPase